MFLGQDVGFTRWGLEVEPTIYHIRGEYPNHYTIDAVYWKKNKKTMYNYEMVQVDFFVMNFTWSR